MSDIVVTMPLSFKYGGLKGLAAWISEGDAAGDISNLTTGREYCFTLSGNRPPVKPGDRVYVVHNKHLIGYAPLVSLESYGNWNWGLIRGGGAVAVTIDEEIPGFQGWRYRWWGLQDERPFPEWRNCGRPQKAKAPTLF